MMLPSARATAASTTRHAAAIAPSLSMRAATTRRARTLLGLRCAPAASRAGFPIAPLGQEHPPHKQQQQHQQPAEPAACFAVKAAPPLLSVAIDFGAHGSGWAAHDAATGEVAVGSSSSSSSNHTGSSAPLGSVHKTRTALLYQLERGEQGRQGPPKVVAWGDEALTTLACLGEAQAKGGAEAPAGDLGAFYLATGFKAALHEGPEGPVTRELKERLGLSAEQVVADYLWHLSTHVKRRLRDLPWAVGGGGDGPRRQAPLHDIAWSIGVPAGWDAATQARLRRAAALAGLCAPPGTPRPLDFDAAHDLEVGEGSLVLVAEPEAAAVTTLVAAGAGTAESGGGPAVSIKPGMTVAVLDVGAGTVDLSVHTVLGDARWQQQQQQRLGAAAGGRDGEDAAGAQDEGEPFDVKAILELFNFDEDFDSFDSDAAAEDEEQDNGEEGNGEEDGGAPWDVSGAWPFFDSDAEEEEGGEEEEEDEEGDAGAGGGSESEGDGGDGERAASPPAAEPGPPPLVLSEALWSVGAPGGSWQVDERFLDWCVRTAADAPGVPPYTPLELAHLMHWWQGKKHAWTGLPEDDDVAGDGSVPGPLLVPAPAGGTPLPLEHAAVREWFALACGTAGRLAEAHLSLLPRSKDGASSSAPPCDLVVLTGGFANSPYVQAHLRGALRGRARVAAQVVAAPFPQLAVMQGASLLRLHPELLHSRRARACISLLEFAPAPPAASRAARPPRRSAVAPPPAATTSSAPVAVLGGAPVWVQEEGCFYAARLRPLVVQGQQVRRDQVVAHDVTPLRLEQAEARIHLFATPRPQVARGSGKEEEEEVEPRLLCELRVHGLAQRQGAGEEEEAARPVRLRVELSFVGAELGARVWDVRTGAEHQVTLAFPSLME